MGSGFRWCRFAQPPATFWHPSGMFLETLLAMGCAAWGHAAYRLEAMGRILNVYILILVGHGTPLGGEGVRLESGRIRLFCGLCVLCG